MSRCIFLDRDGVVNYDDPNYVYELAKFRIYQEAPIFISKFKELGFLIVIISNQAGISKGLYTIEQTMECFKKLQEECNQGIDDFYYSPYHPTITRSLSRKPGALLFERAIAKWGIDPSKSWMIGDKPSDLEPAKKLGISTIGMQRGHELPDDFPIVQNLAEASHIIESSFLVG